MHRVTGVACGVALVAGLAAACGARTGLPGMGRDGGGGDPWWTETGGGGASSEGGGPEVAACDPDLLFVYLVTAEQQLLEFDPAAGAVRVVGTLECPSAYTPFSMAVGRRGRAYSLWGNFGSASGELFEVDVQTAGCEPTDWVPRTTDFGLFGMGYALDDDGGGETLYVAEAGVVPPVLARLDTDDLDLEVIGPLDVVSDGGLIELTSSDDGALYGYLLHAGPGGTLLRIDKETAAVLASTELPVPAAGASSLAFAYWNGDFYIFTGDGFTTEVNVHRPALGTTELITTLDWQVVGAGVTTCDPDAPRGAAGSE